MKFVGQPKHALDFHHQKKVAKKVDALLNAKIFDLNGNPAGKVICADGNTIYQITVNTSVSCKSYDPTKPCTAGIFYKILDSDSIVTTGIVCAGSSTPVKATPGKFLALKNTPALKNDGTDLPYYIPQIPDASGSLVPDDPTGALDPKNAKKYWELFTPSQICEGVV